MTPPAKFPGLVSPPSSSFARATGVREGRKECTQCGEVFPVTVAGAKKCPQCGSPDTKDVVEVGQ